MSTDANYPKTRAASRSAYRNIKRGLTGPTPAETVANVRSTLEGWVGPVRRPSDVSRNLGVWLPHFSIMAIAQALADAERELARQERQPAQRVAS